MASPHQMRTRFCWPKITKKREDQVKWKYSPDISTLLCRKAGNISNQAEDKCLDLNGKIWASLPHPLVLSTVLLRFCHCIHNNSYQHYTMTPFKSCWIFIINRTRPWIRHPSPRQVWTVPSTQNVSITITILILCPHNSLGNGRPFRTEADELERITWEKII